MIRQQFIDTFVFGTDIILFTILRILLTKRFKIKATVAAQAFSLAEAWSIVPLVQTETQQNIFWNWIGNFVQGFTVSRSTAWHHH